MSYNVPSIIYQSMCDPVESRIAPLDARGLFHASPFVLGLSDNGRPHFPGSLLQAPFQNYRGISLGVRQADNIVVKMSRPRHERRFR